MPYIIERKEVSLTNLQFSLIIDILFERKIQLKKQLESADSISEAQEIRNEIHAIEMELLPAFGYRE